MIIYKRSSVYDHRRRKYNKRLSAEIERLNKIIETYATEESDTDTAIRNAAKKVLPESWIDGDSFFVPPLNHIVDKLVARIAELESHIKTLIKDESDTDTYIRAAAMKVMPESEVNGDSYGVPPIENLFTHLIERLDKVNKLCGSVQSACDTVILEKDKRIAELELEVKARDVAIERMHGRDCSKCSNSYKICGGWSAECRNGMIAFAKRELEKEAKDD